MTTSTEITKIATALLAAQRQLEPVVKNATNPHFRSKYASLDNILAAVVPVLNKNGITLLQTQTGDGLSAVLLHESGQWINGGTLRYVIDKDNMQGLGSAVTYARRYTLGALLGIATEEDDDGNAASAAPRQRQATPEPKHTPAPRDEEPADNMTPVDWRSVLVPIGKNKGKALGDLDASVVKWYAENYKENSKYEDSVAFRKALDASQDQEPGDPF